MFLRTANDTLSFGNWSVEILVANKSYTLEVINEDDVL